MLLGRHTDLKWKWIVCLERLWRFAMKAWRQLWIGFLSFLRHLCFYHVCISTLDQVYFFNANQYTCDWWIQFVLTCNFYIWVARKLDRLKKGKRLSKEKKLVKRRRITSDTYAFWFILIYLYFNCKKIQYDCTVLNNNYWQSFYRHQSANKQ